MSDQAVSTSVVVELKQEVPSFLGQSIDLKRVLRDVAKQAKPAVDALVKLMLESKDEKIKLAAAKTLLELNVSVAKEINTDQMQRLIAEVKLTGAGKKLVPVDDEEDNRPLVDFGTIREVS